METLPSDKIRLKEIEMGRPMGSILRDLVQAGLTQRQMAERLRVSTTTVNKWLKRYGFERTYSLPSA